MELEYLVTDLGQILITGSMIGGLYALYSVGLSLTWGILRYLNFAHLSFGVVSGYITYEFAENFGWDPWLTVAVTVPTFFVVGVLIEFWSQAYDFSVFESLMISVGLFLLFEAGMSWYWTANFRRISIQANPYYTDAYFLGPFNFPLIHIVAFVLGVGVCLGLYYFLFYTYRGKAIRALTEDYEVATTFGINYSALGLLVGGLAGATAGLAGVLVGMDQILYPTSPELWVAPVFSAVILGGLGNPLGVLVSALIIGIAETFVSTFSQPALARLFTLLILIMALLFKPNGLFTPILQEH